MPEYRLIPVDEKDEQDAVNMIDLLRSFRDHKSLVKRILSISLLLGVFFALVSTTEFQTNAELMPEMQESSGSGAGALLQQYGGALGLGGLQGMVSQEDEGQIPPEVYPRIVQSLTFSHKLLNSRITFAEPDTTLQLFDYFDRYYKLSPMEWILRNTVGVPGRIMRSLSDQQLPSHIRERLEEENLEHLTYDQYKALQKIQGRVYVTLNPETGILVVSAELPDAAASAQLCKIAIEMLTDYLKDYRTQKARQDLQFQTEQVRLAEERFDSTQQAWTNYLDQNLNPATNSAQARQQRLRAEYDLAYELYTTASQQQAEARRELQEQTPVFKVIQEASVPMEPSKPRRVLTVITFLVVGAVTAYLYISIRRIYDEIRSKM
ncbi:MAG: hypothetical protein U5K31_02300 [Balneolaceae bacterium]|nr:hypothetical protein [Balneolaceae bacterium]